MKNDKTAFIIFILLPLLALTYSCNEQKPLDLPEALTTSINASNEVTINFALKADSTTEYVVGDKSTAKIYYSTDSTQAPLATSDFEYTKPFAIQKPTTIQAFAKNGEQTFPTQTFEFSPMVHPVTFTNAPQSRIALTNDSAGQTGLSVALAAGENELISVKIENKVYEKVASLKFALTYNEPNYDLTITPTIQDEKIATPPIAIRIGKQGTSKTLAFEAWASRTGFLAQPLKSMLTINADLILYTQGDYFPLALDEYNQIPLLLYKNKHNHDAWGKIVDSGEPIPSGTYWFFYKFGGKPEFTANGTPQNGTQKIQIKGSTTNKINLDGDKIFYVSLVEEKNEGSTNFVTIQEKSLLPILNPLPEE